MSDMSRDQFGERFGVSHETLDRLRTYETLLRKWNPRINLVAPSTLKDVWRRHFHDSAQLLALAPMDVRVWADLGSGAGFPGLVLAILAMEKRPGARFHLVESDRRKAVFLNEAIRNTGAPADVHAGRIESLLALRADTLSARALAPLERLLPMVLRHGKPETVALFLKGRNHPGEIASASKRFDFDCEVVPSEIDPEGVILKIQRVKERNLG